MEGYETVENFNEIINVVNKAMPLVQSGIPALVGGFVTAMFLRGNTERVEFEKIKAGKIGEALDDLVKSRELTLTELVKCKNILDIAKLADEEFAKNIDENEQLNDQEKIFDFDWFLRFFESAGCISDKDMQLLWARILAGETGGKKHFSLRTIETLKNFSKEDCVALQNITPFIIYISKDFQCLWDDIDYSSQYMKKDELLTLYDLDIISTNYNIIRPTKEESPRNFMSMNEFGLVEHSCEHDYKVTVSAFTLVGRELLSIVNRKTNHQIELDLLRKIKQNYPKLDLRIHKIVEYTSEGEVIYDSEFL